MRYLKEGEQLGSSRPRARFNSYFYLKLYFGGPILRHIARSCQGSNSSVFEMFLPKPFCGPERELPESGQVK